MKHNCSRCNRSQDVELVKVFRYKYNNKKGVEVFKPMAGGHLIYGNICRDCKMVVLRKNRGYSKRSESKKPQVIAAVGAERAAAEHFRSLGFTVEQVDAIGPDLKCKIGNLTWTVEVKRVTKGSRSLRVSCVRPLRRADDLVAMVFPDNRIYIDSMKNHLSKCSKNGSRSVTGLFKQLCFDEV